MTLLAAVVGMAQSQAPPPGTDDPYVWLEDKEGARAMEWVAAENARTLPRLQNDPRYAAFYKEAYAIAAATDRIAYPELINGRVLNLWRDDAHPHGLWRWTTPADYATASPQWKTLVDLDALGKAEGKEWVFKGADCLPPEERRCLIALSEGGEDAVSVREFDLVTGQFVSGGFSLPTSKQDVAWLDTNTLLVARDWGPGTMTTSGYPYVVKKLVRGQSLEQATEVFRGTASDVATSPLVLHDASGSSLPLIVRSPTFFSSEIHALTPAGAVKLPFPEKMDLYGMVDGHVIFRSKQTWSTAGKTLRPGVLLSVERTALNGGPLKPAVLFQPSPRQSVENAVVTRSRVVATILDNVRGRAKIFTPRGGGWNAQSVPLPDNASIGVVSSTEHGDDLYLEVTGFLTPTTLWTLDAATGKADTLKSLPARFDASRHVVEQFAATSSDGTKIPYFIVHRKDMPRDGSTPTIMTAYGGFENSETPTYLSTRGKLWVESGNSFVLANIRGGGEFGPAWHEAGLKTRRQIIYDDFAAVAKDIFARRLSSPRRFGIYGGSNGGLLMGVEFNQHPELWRAVVIQVPLLDMLRYEQIQAGASWVDEYGSVSVPAEKAFLAKISPYHNLKKGKAYPEPFIWTTTKDDRVGPQHARKFAARMKEFGLPYLFYEDTAGGHSGDADIAQGAKLKALETVYFAQKLVDAAGGVEPSSLPR
jgi:prolyl oligopeptidase